MDTLCKKDNIMARLIITLFVLMALGSPFIFLAVWNEEIDSSVSYRDMQVNNIEHEAQNMLPGGAVIKDEYEEALCVCTDHYNSWYYCN